MSCLKTLDRLRLLLLLLALSGCAAAPPDSGLAALPPQPESATGYQHKTGLAFRQRGVAAANPLAAEAGHEILRQGGAAIDAAVAVQAVLGLVEPQSSGIGGGAFLMYWDGREVQAYDGRETAPAAADERQFLGTDGRPMPFQQAVVSGLSVGTPGVLRMLEMAHRAQGRLPWADLFAPAIALAEQGFELSPRLHELLQRDPALRQDAQARAYFYDAQGQPWPVGHRLRNPALAAVLREIAARGTQAFYAGPIAADMVRRVHGHARPGRLSETDLADYRPLRREPICSDWQPEGRTPLRVCGFPPPSSGHLTMMQMLGLMAARQASAPLAAPALQDGIPSAPWLHIYTEAARLAFADRARYIADPAFVSAPAGDWRSLLAPDYLRGRSALIGERSMGVAQPGEPGAQRLAWASQPEQPEHGTSHISIVDAAGQALAMTTTVESVFGSRIMSDGGTGKVGGFLLNNQLTDFSLAPRDAQGRPVANRVEPGKRPRSSMSPTLVFDAASGRLRMSLGSPGGPAIIHFTAKTLLATMAWGLDAQQAIELPNFGSFNGPTALESGRFPAATAAALKALGHQVVETDLTSGLQAIVRTPEGWFGAADPRREGAVKGD